MLIDGGASGVGDEQCMDQDGQRRAALAHFRAQLSVKAELKGKSLPLDSDEHLKIDKYGDDAADTAQAQKSETIAEVAARRTRTAVCVSGHIRTLNLKPGSPTWPSLLINLPVDSPAAQWDVARIKVGDTVAESLQSNLFSALDEFDVFMSVSTREGEKEPKIGDLSACEPLRPRTPGSQLFCEVIREQERKLFSDSEIWKTFYYSRPALQQGLLQQLYGMYRCSVMIRRHMLSSTSPYDYMIRLRPDMWMHVPMPPIHLIVTENNVIKYSDPAYYPGGNEDWFGVGTSDAMLPYLERYLALQNVGSELKGMLEPTAWGSRSWRAEFFLRWYLKDIYNISLAADKRIVAGIVKTMTSAPSAP